MPGVIPTRQSFQCQVLRFGAGAGRLFMPLPRLRTMLLANRPGYVIFGLALTRLALAAGDEYLRRAFFGCIGVETLAFLVALVLGEFVVARLAVLRVVVGALAGG